MHHRFFLQALRYVKKEMKYLVHRIVDFNRYRTIPESQTCLRPCQEVKAISKLKNWAQLSTDYSVKLMGINLNFRKTVKVTTHHKAYGLFDLIVDVGSSLGLWIGLSALGMFDLVIEAGHWVSARRPGMLKRNAK